MDSVGDIVEVGTLGLVDGGDISGENAADAAKEGAAITAEGALKGVKLLLRVKDRRPDIYNNKASFQCSSETGLYGRLDSSIKAGQVSNSLLTKLKPHHFTTL